jgi:hypothetical protein
MSCDVDGLIPTMRSFFDVTSFQFPDKRLLVKLECGVACRTDVYAFYSHEKFLVRAVETARSMPLIACDSL